MAGFYVMAKSWTQSKVESMKVFENLRLVEQFINVDVLLIKRASYFYCGHWSHLNMSLTAHLLFWRHLEGQ
jgi:hypothetical protein